MKNLEQLIVKLKEDTDNVTFQEVIDVIAENYSYTPSQFSNGTGDTIVINEAGTNEGSCRIFAFAQLNQLSKEQTLHCFGDYYRQDVLENPDGNDHGNIRQFMRSGWPGICFEQTVLSLKSS